jgi:hypothetical protein
MPGAKHFVCRVYVAQALYQLEQTTFLFVLMYTQLLARKDNARAECGGMLREFVTIKKQPEKTSGLGDSLKKPLP